MFKIPLGSEIIFPRHGFQMRSSMGDLGFLFTESQVNALSQI